MKKDSLSLDITTASEFQSALGKLLNAAAQNGIDPRGSWVYTNNDGLKSDWETMVYEIKSPAEADD